MTDESIADRDLLAEIGNLRRELDGLARRTTESAAEAEASETAAIEAEADRHRRAVEQAEMEFARICTEAEEACRDARETAETRRKTEEQRIRTEADDLRIRIRRKVVANEAAAEEALEEAVWLAESVYEAGEGQPREEFEKIRTEVAKLLDEVEGLRKQIRREARRYRQVLPSEEELGEHDRSEAEFAPLEVIRSGVPHLRQRAAEFRRLRIARFFRGPVLVLPATLLIGGMILIFWSLGRRTSGDLWLAGTLGAGAFAVGFSVLYVFARREVIAAWTPLAALSKKLLHAAAMAEEVAERHRHEQERDLVATRDEDLDEARRKYEPIGRLARSKAAARLKELDRRVPLNLQRLEEECRRSVALAEEQRRTTVEDAESNRVRVLEAEAATHADRVRGQAEAARARWTSLEEAWRAGVGERMAALESHRDRISKAHPPLSQLDAGGWIGAQEAPEAIRLGSLRYDRGLVEGGLPIGARFDLEFPDELDLPAIIALPTRSSLHLDLTPEDRDRGLELLRSTMLRILATVPPGKARFTILDPIGLGQNFAGFMHLEDELPGLVGERIWTEARQIEQRLVDITEHMETVIQKYLRNEFSTIDEYNAEAGEIAEPYRFLVVADFPANFSEEAARRLASIVQSGPRCGVFTLLLRDRRLDLPDRFDPGDLERHAITIRSGSDRFIFDAEDLGDLEFTPDPGPTDALLIEMSRVVGRAAREAGRVEVPFSTIAPPPEAFWSRSATETLQVALGRAGATRLQEMVFGRGTAQHALIAGKTGSGKSTLLHALITNLACWHSPDEVELHLVDFKKGVEFKTYATHRIPHVKSVAVESDREFGVSVLKGLDRQLSERGDLFRAAGVQDLAGWRERHPDQAMPRVLLVIDEFQELFVEDDEVSQEASLLLDRLVRQGRAFGIHLLLGSQTLGGVYSLNRSTMGQMGIRVALACNEQDSMLILSDDNVAARLLSRPGEAIYNDQGGLLEGNSPFQVCWLPDEVREEYLVRIGELARDRGVTAAPQVVFEGNAPAILAENRLLATMVETAPESRPTATPLWLGDPVAIKDPTAAVLRRQSGSNVAIVGQQDETALAMMTAALVSAAASHPLDQLRVVVLDGTPADDPNAGYLDGLAGHLPHRVDRPDFRGADTAMEELGAELARRMASDAGDAPTIILAIHGLQRFRALRRAEDDFGFSTDDTPATPDRIFGELLREGPEHGIFVVLWSDNLATLERCVDRRTMRSFDQRVLLQIGATDSSSLIDSPAASMLGPNRGLIHSDERGSMEKFRPWALPSMAYLAAAGRVMQGRNARDTPA